MSFILASLFVILFLTLSLFYSCLSIFLNTTPFLSASETGFILICVLWLSAAWSRGNINMCFLMSQAPSSVTPPSLRRRISLTNRNSLVNDCLHEIWLVCFHISISINVAFQTFSSHLFFDPVSVFIVKLNRLHKRKQIHPATSAGAGWHLGSEDLQTFKKKHYL